MAHHDPALPLRALPDTHLFFAPAPREPDVRAFIMHNIFCYEVRRDAGGTYSAHFHEGFEVWADLARGVPEAAAYRAVADHIPCLPPKGVLPHFWDFDRREAKPLDPHTGAPLRAAA